MLFVHANVLDSRECVRVTVSAFIEQKRNSLLLIDSLPVFEEGADHLIIRLTDLVMKVQAK